MDVNNATGVPTGFTKITTNTVKASISRGQLTKVALFPRIGNEHVESSREIQGVVSDGNILTQGFRASKDNITALILTVESAEGVVVDDFEGYLNSVELQDAWVETGAVATLESVIINRGTQAMRLPTTNADDEWVVTAAPTDYTGYTGIFAAYFSHAYAQQKVSVFIGDGVNTKSFVIPQEDAAVWCSCEVNEAAMTEDGEGTTTVSAITVIGYRVEEKKIGGFVVIDDLISVPPAGEIEIKLHDMGVEPPVTGETSIDDGEQYTQIGDAKASSYMLQLLGGKRIYHIEDFRCGANKEDPFIETLNVDNYYLIELKWVDTDVSVYGPDTTYAAERGSSYYNNGFASTAPDEATPITQIGEYSDLMFAILSAQDIYVVKDSWRFDNPPNGNSDITVFLEDRDMGVVDTIVDLEHSPEQEFTSDVSLRPMLLEDGGKVEHYFNDDPTDLVTTINVEVQFLYEPPKVHG